MARDLGNYVATADGIASSIRGAFSQQGQAFLRAALEPLRHTTLQTGLLLALCILVAWLLARFIRSATWRFSKPRAVGLEIVTTHHSNDQQIALSPEEYIRAFANDPEIYLTEHPTRAARIAWTADRHKRLQSQYFVVTLVQRDDAKTPRVLGRPVLNREVRIWKKSNPLREGFIQLDASCLRELRDRNNSSIDDDDGTAVDGKYDLYLRRVRWWDVRHWLVHPNRELRIAIWVTIISTFVPNIVQALLAPLSGS